MMHIGMLGPVLLRTDSGREIAPRGNRQRLLFATLLLHAPRAVSPERLIQILWGEDSPDNPGAALRTQVSRLRTFLDGADCPGRIWRAEPSGYGLRLEAAELDTARFEDLHRRAREASAPERGLALADEALALWRDEPFGEFHDLPHFLGEASRLRELRTGACERRVECLLALGRTAEALAAVEVLVHADPLRERPRALGMQALYQAGRQHDALASFQDYRRNLSEELGLEPSPALRALEAEILHHTRPAAPMPGPASGRLAPSSVGSLEGDLPEGPDARVSGTGLPAALTPLIGREHERASVHRLLRSMRLVTLIGPGGSGKTRLALEVARRVPGEVAWVELGAIPDANFVAHEIAATLGVRERPGRTGAESLLQAMRDRALILVLDNCEHLVEPCAAIVGSLLRDCPDLVVLATSREPLGVVGEAIWPVPPLCTPDDASRDLAELGRCESVRLFCDRAASAHPTFALTEENRAAVVEICRRLDGLPLALELAAARVRHLSPREIAGRLENDFDLLSGGSRSTLTRHQTLRAAIDWSVRLLSDAERSLFESISVFAGGFCLGAVEAVCDDGEQVPPGTVFELLCGLVDKSLLATHETEGATRYRMLETVRGHAGERLAARGAKSEMRRRHAEHFADRAEEAEPLLVSAERAATGRRLAADQENLRAALAWAVSDSQGAEAAHRLTGSLWWFWHYVGRFEEARRWAEATLATPAAGVSDQLRARVRYTAAMACWLLGDPEAACAHAAESTRIARALAEPSLLVRAISAHAFALRDVGELAPAKALAAECVAVARSAAFPPAEMGFALWIQCTALLQAGDVESAEAAAREAETLWRSTGDRWGLSMVLHGMGMAELGRGELEPAAHRFREAIDLLRRDGEPYFVARSIEGLAIVRVHQGDLDRASRLFGAAEAIRETIGAPLLAFEEARYRQTIAILAPLLESQKRAASWAEGRSMTLDEAVTYSLAPAGPLPATGPPM
jgi:predicted ATPase/DNA-binding SARP family transcriptional activator